MPLNTDLLRSTFETVVERQPAITPRFYEILFSRYPEAKPLFGRNAARAQEEMLQKALVAVIENLDDAAWLGSTMFALGAKHVGYGVTRPMYDWVGDALLSTLAEILDGEWNADVAAAWGDAYAALRDLMLAGMAAEAASVPAASGSSSAVSASA